MREGEREGGREREHREGKGVDGENGRESKACRNAGRERERESESEPGDRSRQRRVVEERAVEKIGNKSRVEKRQEEKRDMSTGKEGSKGYGLKNK